MEHPYEFTLNGRRWRATVAEIEEAVRGAEPQPVRCHAVEIGGVRYPVKQAFSRAFGLHPNDFTTYRARRVLVDMGFTVTTSPVDERKLRRLATETAGTAKAGSGTARQPGSVRPRFPRAAGLARPERWEADPDDGTPAAQVQALELPPIVLAWSPWQPWNELRRDERLRTGAPRVPAGRPGVYEVIRYGTIERLTIGKARDLRVRVKHHMIMGHGLHPSGDLIRENEDTSRVLVRWAITDRPAAAEEELHQRYVREHGKLPKYTKQT